MTTDHVSLHRYRCENDPYPDKPDAVHTVFCQGIDRQVSHIAQVLSHLSATLSYVVHLKLEDLLEDDRELEGTDDVVWLHLLRQFPTVQALHIYHELAGHVILASEEIGQIGEVIF